MQSAHSITTRFLTLIFLFLRLNQCCGSFFFDVPIPPLNSARLGPFKIRWSTDDPFLLITRPRAHIGDEQSNKFSRDEEDSFSDNSKFETEKFRNSELNSEFKSDSFSSKRSNDFKEDKDKDGDFKEYKEEKEYKEKEDVDGDEGWIDEVGEEVVFRSLVSWPFLTVGFATDSKPPIVDGNFKVDEWTLFETPKMTIARVSVGKARVRIEGELSGLVTRAGYVLDLHAVDDLSHEVREKAARGDYGSAKGRERGREKENVGERGREQGGAGGRETERARRARGVARLHFNVTATPIVGSFNRIFLNYWCHPKENFYGLGVQYTHWNLKGRRVPILVAEQGIGRGAQPTTIILNTLADGTGGDSMTTYAPKPLYITNFNRSIVFENNQIMFFDFRDDDAVVVEVWSNYLSGFLISCGREIDSKQKSYKGDNKNGDYNDDQNDDDEDDDDDFGGGILGLIQGITRLTGRMKKLPSWTQKGIILGLEGGTASVETLVDSIEKEMNKLKKTSRVNKMDELGNELSKEMNEVSLIAGIWLQDWVGVRTAFDGDRLKWGWTLDFDHYGEWAGMTQRWAARGIRTLTYINPFFSNLEGERRREGEKENEEETEVEKGGGGLGNASLSDVEKSKRSNKVLSDEGYSASRRSSERRRDFFLEGVDGGYFVRDRFNSPYRLRSGSIEFFMLDPSNPRARQWVKEIIKKEMIVEASAYGWMADFGEYLPFDAVLFSGEKGSDYHNKYPQEWAQINKEAVEEAMQEKLRQKVRVKSRKIKGIKEEILENKDDNYDWEEEGVVFFLRSAWLKSPSFSTLFWLGDQTVTWDEFDGIKTIPVGLLSGGIGGHSLTHSDIGGYTMQELSPFPLIRSRELLYRWLEMEVFSSPLLRTHIGSSMSQNQAQMYMDRESILFFAQFTHIFAFLAPYRKKLMTQAARKGFPLVRSMAAHFAYDSVCWELQNQFLFGPDFLVAPVLDETRISSFRAHAQSRNRGNFTYSFFSVASVRVYIPAHSDWIHLWTGREVSGGKLGKHITVDSPFGHPPVFYKINSFYGKELREFVVRNNYDAINYEEKNELEFERDTKEKKDSSLKDESITIESNHFDKNETNFLNSETCVGGGELNKFEEMVSSGIESINDFLDLTISKLTYLSETIHLNLENLENENAENKKDDKCFQMCSEDCFCEKSVIGLFSNFRERTWLDFFGLSKFHSSWDAWGTFSTQYSEHSDTNKID